MGTAHQPLEPLKAQKARTIQQHNHDIAYTRITEMAVPYYATHYRTVGDADLRPHSLLHSLVIDSWLLIIRISSAFNGQSLRPSMLYRFVIDLVSDCAL